MRTEPNPHHSVPSGPGRDPAVSELGQGDTGSSEKLLTKGRGITAAEKAQQPQNNCKLQLQMGVPWNGELTDRARVLCSSVPICFTVWVKGASEKCRSCYSCVFDTYQAGGSPRTSAFSRRKARNVCTFNENGDRATFQQHQLHTKIKSGYQN